MQITVFGASGKVGRRVVELALQRGYTVVAFVHSHDPFARTPQLIVKKGDIYRGDEIADAIKGSSAIISCLGSWGTKKRNVLTSAMQAIIPAMFEQKIVRIVTLTGSGAMPPDQKLTLTHRLIMKLLMLFPAGKVFWDGEEHMRLLAGTALDWTSLRSPVMKQGPAAPYTLTRKPGPIWRRVSRTTVATAILDALERSDPSAYRAPVIRPQ